MANNHTVRMKPGEIGFTFIAVFKDAQNEEIPLISYTPAIAIATRRTTFKDRETLLLRDMTPDPDQVVNTGLASYTITEEDPTFAPGKYNLEFFLTDPAGDVQKFPKQEGKPFAILEVMPTTPPVE